MPHDNNYNYVVQLVTHFVFLETKILIGTCLCDQMFVVKFKILPFFFAILIHIHPLLLLQDFL